MTRDEQKYLKDAKKQLELSVKNKTKSCGFQKINGFVYQFLDNFVYVLTVSVPPVKLGKEISVSLGFKPLTLDYLFWEIFEITQGKTQPKSFHVQGAFTAPLAGIKKWSETVETIDHIPAAYQNILQQASSLITQQSSDINTILQFQEYLKTKDYQELNTILCEIHLQNYNNALTLLNSEIAKGKSGGFADSNSKSIYQYAKDFCTQKV